MSYTVWMDGVSIGHSALEVRQGANRRAGIFHPTEFGLSVLPGITDMGPALLDVGRMCRDGGMDLEDFRLDAERASQEVFGTPEGNRVLEAAKQIARLELRAPSGDFVPWESILITDLNALGAAASGRSPGEDATSQGDAPQARYFISAKFGTKLRDRVRRSLGRCLS